MRLAFWKKDKTKGDGKKKPVWREWLDAGIFAIVAATIIRTFFIEAYTIPTPSMEGSMLVNDFLFVSKMAYGPRIPMTPVAVPLVHNTFLGGKSYSESVQWKYHRLPGFGHVERNDVVVFNFPNGDTVIAEMPDRDYYEICRQEGGREVVQSKYTIITRPVDKKENYIKRCIGLPGDKIEIVDGIVSVNDQPAVLFPHSKMDYIVATKAPGLSSDFLEDNGITIKDAGSNIYQLNIPNDALDAVKTNPAVASIHLAMLPKGATADWAFPQDPANFHWNRDNYGPLVIPKKGSTITLTPQNIALYRRIISRYEDNKLEEKDGKFFINGKETTTYTFKMDYYWMMGDNRHDSADSRYWGFVPEDHVVGKASFVWLSYEGSLFHLRWSRLFHSVKSLSK